MHLEEKLGKDGFREETSSKDGFREETEQGWI